MHTKSFVQEVFVKLGYIFIFLKYTFYGLMVTRRARPIHLLANHRYITILLVDMKTLVLISTVLVEPINALTEHVHANTPKTNSMTSCPV